jgi:hypothetical protein
VNTQCRLTLSALLLITASATALADGMPYPKQKKPETVVLPLDKAIDEIEKKEPPANIATPTPAIEQNEPVKKAVTAAPLAEPVPESRVVQVQPNTSFFGLSVGTYGIGHSDDDAPSINAEWQPGVKIAGVLQPLFGAMFASNGAMLGYGGVGVPLKLSPHVFMMPSVAVGAYREGSGYDLGQTLAYRFGTEIGYEFDNKSRVGLNAHLITNGVSFKKEDRAGVISLVYTMPVDFLSGKSHSSRASEISPPKQ